MATFTKTQPELGHLYAIETLAKESSLSLEEVKTIYYETLDRLSPGAHVKDYLIVLTSKKVRDELRQIKHLTLSQNSTSHRQSHI